MTCATRRAIGWREFTQGHFALAAARPGRRARVVAAGPEAGSATSAAAMTIAAAAERR